MLERQEGASPLVVGSYCECRLAVASDNVDAGARCPQKHEYVSGAGLPDP